MPFNNSISKNDWQYLVTGFFFNLSFYFYRFNWSYW